MNPHSLKPGGLTAALTLGVCLAASSLCPAQSLTPETTQAPAAKKSTTSTSAHPATKTATAHPATHTVARKASSSKASSTRKSTAHATTQAATKSSANHPSTSSARKTTTASNSKARTRKPRPLTGAQRLARLHLAPERIQEIQQALSREGYLQQEPNGQWDARTREAMLRYQTDHGFPATGLPEAKSLMKLGLGSHPLPPDLDPSLAHATLPEAGKEEPSVVQTPPPTSQEIAPQHQ